jgi:hypothetical protein
MSGVSYHRPGEMPPMPEVESSSPNSYRFPYRYVIYTFLTILFLVLILWLAYAVVTRPDREFIIGKFLLDVPPYVWGQLGLTLAFGLPCLGAAW